jgi:FkbM family methyltransferase
VKQRVKQSLGRPLTHLHADWSILEVIGPVQRKHVLLDVGAHHGWFFHCWQDWCPSARVIAFEPFAESFETMQRLYGNDSRVQLVQAGVGSVAGSMELNVLNDSKVSNSFLQPADEAWRNIAYEHGQVSRVTVPVTTLDEVFRQQQLGGVYLVKIDVQGYEIEVLKGAEQSLPKIDHIFVESGIQRLYESAPRFNDVFEFLTARGFHLMAMRSWHRGNHVLVETDMLFRRDELVPPVEVNADRAYTHI